MKIPRVLVARVGEGGAKQKCRVAPRYFDTAGLRRALHEKELYGEKIVENSGKGRINGKSSNYEIKGKKFGRV